MSEHAFKIWILYSFKRGINRGKNESGDKKTSWSSTRTVTKVDFHFRIFKIGSMPLIAISTGFHYLDWFWTRLRDEKLGKFDFIFEFLFFEFHAVNPPPYQLVSAGFFIFYFLLFHALWETDDLSFSNKLIIMGICPKSGFLYKTITSRVQQKAAKKRICWNHFSGYL